MSTNESQLLAVIAAAIHSQLDKVRSSLRQLHNALGDGKDIQNSLTEVSSDWRKSINIIENLKDVKYAGVQHSQLASEVKKHEEYMFSA
ncbi:exocyst complex component 3-like [Salvelinus namaycush]|uniref:Exocyst complex component 3-like n=1 Tax=Salvelinus namaycush TaxID=8040 RepID=A0A8U1BRE3_SALNM|nr:exocyst complex component 3-like [Salvelinus namaycush]